MDNGPETLWAVVLGAVLATLGGFVATRLEAFADAHIAPSAQGDVRKARAQIEYSARVRRERLPEVDRWLAGHTG